MADVIDFKIYGGDMQMVLQQKMKGVDPYDTEF